MRRGSCRGWQASQLSCRMRVAWLCLRVRVRACVSLRWERKRKIYLCAGEARVVSCLRVRVRECGCVCVESDMGLKKKCLWAGEAHAGHAMRKLAQLTVTMRVHREVGRSPVPAAALRPRTVVGRRAEYMYVCIIHIFYVLISPTAHPVYAFFPCNHMGNFHKILFYIAWEAHQGWALAG